MFQFYQFLEHHFYQLNQSHSSEREWGFESYLLSMVLFLENAYIEILLTTISIPHVLFLRSISHRVRLLACQLITLKWRAKMVSSFLSYNWSHMFCKCNCSIDSIDSLNLVLFGVDTITISIICLIFSHYAPIQCIYKF